ncbi:dipeptidase [Aquisalimonas asiatica]|uniref:Zn-dependent dipeptidase, dipeptidase homolog n=1 Tax=Aquisalimonas asiatica TaxID=406100 RepID=A0A1H8SJJ3_9GAMM|nr:dipeptidase [Aquisalimonas asiatica]SEO78696.1 Zn-dependent dipeptidase, dipeptidase homolog [Aquisalimonas asiatica]
MSAKASIDIAAARELHERLTVVDGLQYSNWDRSVFQQLHEGGVHAVHVTVAYWENARETLSRIGEWGRRYAAHGDLIRPVAGAADIRQAREEGRVGVFYGFQNCSPIEDEIDLVAVFRQLGVFLMQLTYNNQSLLGTGCYEEEDTGITRFGREVIREMNRVGMIIDMSHSAERTTLEAIELSARPVVVSHANPLFFRDVARNKSERVLRALAGSGGLLGFSAYPLHLGGGSECTLDAYCDMIARTADLMGVEHLGIGTDLCHRQPDQVLGWMRNGRWRRVLDGDEPESPRWPAQPAWFRDGSDFPNITAGLLARGFSETEIAGIMGENWLRVLEQGIAPQSQ